MCSTFEEAQCETYHRLSVSVTRRGAPILTLMARSLLSLPERALPPARVGQGEGKVKKKKKKDEKRRLVRLLVLVLL